MDFSFRQYHTTTRYRTNILKCFIFKKPNKFLYLIQIDHHNPEPAFALLQLALDNPVLNLEWQAILELISLVKDYPEAAIPVIEHAMENHNPHVRWLAALEMVELAKTYPQQLLPVLKDIVRNNQSASSHSEEPARVLVEYGKECPEAVIPILTTALESNNWNLQCAAALELLELQQIEANRVITILEQSLRDCHRPTGNNETRILIELSDCDTRQVILLLKKALLEGKLALQRAAFYELIEIAKRQASDQILEEIQSLLREEQVS